MLGKYGDRGFERIEVLNNYRKLERMLREMKQNIVESIPDEINLNGIIIRQEKEHPHADYDYPPKIALSAKITPLDKPDIENPLILGFNEKTIDSIEYNFSNGLRISSNIARVCGEPVSVPVYKFEITPPEVDDSTFEVIRIIQDMLSQTDK